MNRFQDIHIIDQPLISNYINYFVNENYSSAFNLLNNAQLDKKKFIDEVLNTINNLVYTLENNYYDNVPDYLNELKNTFQLIIDNYKNMGDYQASVVYQKYNYVLYNNNYYLYINSNPSYNILPINTTYWELIGLIGDEGAPGYGLTFKYDWQSSANYQKYDVVYYDDYLWVATSQNINSEPEESTYAWEKLCGFENANIYINSSQATDPYAGLIWFEIIQ